MHCYAVTRRWTYLSDLLNYKVFALVVEAAGEDVLVLAGAVPYQVVTVHLTLALSQFPVNVTKEPFLVLHWDLGRLVWMCVWVYAYICVHVHMCACVYDVMRVQKCSDTPDDTCK